MSVEDVRVQSPKMNQDSAGGGAGTAAVAARAANAAGPRSRPANLGAVPRGSAAPAGVRTKDGGRNAAGNGRMQSYSVIV